MGPIRSHLYEREAVAEGGHDEFRLDEVRHIAILVDTSAEVAHAGPVGGTSRNDRQCGSDVSSGTVE
jgi:hypothetical protein